MAIHLFCYTSRSINESTHFIELLIRNNQEFFQDRFLISKATEANEVEKEVAHEHRINATTIFLIRVNDKSATPLISEVAAIVKNSFGKSTIVILQENEVER